MQTIEDKIRVAVEARAKAKNGTAEWLLLDELVKSFLKQQHEELQARNRAALDAARRRAEAEE